MEKAVFFDKDGTLIPDIPYNKDTGIITFNEGAEVALRKLSPEFKFFIISNQAGIARGFLTEEDISLISSKINQMFNDAGAELAGFYYCPHDSNGTIEPYNVSCECRKPRPGLLIKASKDNSIDLSASWFVGDILNDVEAGNRAGCRTVLIDNGNETEWLEGDYRTPHFTVKNLEDAADTILAHL